MTRKIGGWLHGWNSSVIWHLVASLASERSYARTILDEVIFTRFKTQLTKPKLTSTSSTCVYFSSPFILGIQFNSLRNSSEKQIKYSLFLFSSSLYFFYLRKSPRALIIPIARIVARGSSHRKPWSRVHEASGVAWRFIDGIEQERASNDSIDKLIVRYSVV